MTFASIWCPKKSIDFFHSFKYFAEVKLVLLYINWCNLDVIEVNEDIFENAECMYRWNVCGASECHVGEFE